MFGLMVDAYKLRKKTEEFDCMLGELFAEHRGNRPDLKTSRFINGKGGWNKIESNKRKAFLTEICKLAVDNGGKIFGLSLSFKSFDTIVGTAQEYSFKTNYWLASAMFISSLVQKKMQTVRNNKGLTVVIMDDNKIEMPKLSDGLYGGNPWYDGLYQVRAKRRNKMVWVDRTKLDRFDQIVNTAFAIKSDHSSLIQVADAISYVYRRHLELNSSNENWPGEKTFFSGLVDILEPARERLGRCPEKDCIRFYEQIRQSDWTL